MLTFCKGMCSEVSERGDEQLVLMDRLSMPSAFNNNSEYYDCTSYSAFRRFAILAKVVLLSILDLLVENHPYRGLFK